MNIIEIKFQKGRMVVFEAMMDKYIQKSFPPVDINSIDREQEILADIQMILNENICFGGKMYYINTITHAVDSGKWTTIGDI
jgi:hypothetical protein